MSLPIRPDIKASIDRWANEAKFYPGSFVTAVLENNLNEAILRADDYNIQSIKAIVDYVEWEIPHQCWGSGAKMIAWFKQHNPEETDATVEQTTSTAGDVPDASGRKDT